MGTPIQGTLVFAAGSQPVDTSEAAAEELAPDYLDAIRGQVLEYIAARGMTGATADEVAVHFKCAHNHTSPRVTDLRDVGLIQVKLEEPDTIRGGRRVTTAEPKTVKRVTRTGRMARVFVATPRGINLLQHRQATRPQ